MTAPPQTEAKSYRRAWCNIPWLLLHLRRWPWWPVVEQVNSKSSREKTHKSGHKNPLAHACTHAHMPTHACSPKWQVLQSECLPETQARMGGRRGQGWGGALHNPPSQTAITIQQPSASHPERNPACAASPQATGDLCDPCLSSTLIKAFPLTCWCTRWGLEVVNDRLRVCSILGMQNYIAWYLGKHIRGLSISLTVHKGGSGYYQKIPLVIVLILCN